MNQNLISATLSAEDVSSITQAITTLKEKMPFLSSMQKTEINRIFNIGTNFQPFLELAKQVEESHPEILPGVFNKEEFDKDYALFKSIQPISQQLAQINEGMQKALAAVGSDCLDASLEVYAAVKQNKDKVPGLSVTHEAMAAFFKRTRSKTTTG